LAGCPRGGIVLDPFFGSGTTGIVALKNERNYIGIELNEEYIKI
jgi:DNA modification methylase